MRQLYDEHLPVLPGATRVVRELAAAFPLGLASSSPPHLIEFALVRADIRSCFAVVVSADEVGKGKPNPAVFLATARRLGFPPAEIVVFEDSGAGIQAARAAGMRVIAVPNAHYPPQAEVLATADAVLESLQEFEPDMLSKLAGG
jgi:HAD superfamily hydrolase (TIGR01509 family)